MTGNEARDTDDVDLFEDTAGEKSPPEEDSLDADFFFRNPMVNNAFSSQSNYWNGLMYHSPRIAAG
jgi:hypothetical protein